MPLQSRGYQIILFKIYRRTHVICKQENDVWLGFSWCAAASPAQDGSKAAAHAQVKQSTLHAAGRGEMI